MLPKTSAKPLQDAARDYLSDALGIEPTIHPWPASPKLPYFLQDEFELYELAVKDQSVLLAVNRRKKSQAPTTLRDRLNRLRSLTNNPVAYVTATLASYERKRLIEQKIPFIVPGNQLYLPDLGIDLREYFRQSPETSPKSLSPATQAMVIRALLSKSMQNAWHPAAMAANLGYTKMTVSRVVNDLVNAGIAKLAPKGRARWLLMERSPAETWKLIRPFLRTPVKKQFWTQVTPKLKGKHLPLAGLSALASYTQLAEPPLPIFAVGWGDLEEHSSSAEIPEPLPGSSQWQVWNYEPIIVGDAKTNDKRAVDPLSLALSFQGIEDERIDLALEELKGHFPW